MANPLRMLLFPLLAAALSFEKPLEMPPCAGIQCGTLNCPPGFAPNQTSGTCCPFCASDYEPPMDQAAIKAWYDNAPLVEGAPANCKAVYCGDPLCLPGEVVYLPPHACCPACGVPGGKAVAAGKKIEKEEPSGFSKAKAYEGPPDDAEEALQPKNLEPGQMEVDSVDWETPE